MARRLVAAGDSPSWVVAGCATVGTDVATDLEVPDGAVELSSHDLALYPAARWAGIASGGWESAATALAAAQARDALFTMLGHPEEIP